MDLRAVPRMVGRWWHDLCVYPHRPRLVTSMRALRFKEQPRDERPEQHSSVDERPDRTHVSMPGAAPVDTRRAHRIIPGRIDDGGPGSMPPSLRRASREPSARQDSRPVGVRTGLRVVVGQWLVVIDPEENRRRQHSSPRGTPNHRQGKLRLRRHQRLVIGGKTLRLATNH